MTWLVHMLLDAPITAAELRSMNYDEVVIMCLQLEGIGEEVVAVYPCSPLKW